MKKLLGIALVLISLVWMAMSVLFPSKAHANYNDASNEVPEVKHCQGKFVNPVTDICWSCLFPISIGSIKVVGGKNPDTENPSLPICACPAPPPVFVRIGISMGYWEPISLVDISRHPFCLVNLGGISLDIGKFYGSGNVDKSSPEQGGSFYYAHWYVYPLIYWLNLLTDALCMQKLDFDIAYLAELDPTWRDDELGFIINPEAAIFGNPVAQAACALDAVASTAHLPIDKLFWCAGSHGSMYPLMGKVQAHLGGVQSSALLTERMTYKMHRMGLVWNSVGKNSPALCQNYPSPIIPKSRYRYQMTNPLPAASDCRPFGYTTTLWGSMHEYPYKGEDFGYLVLRKRNCCSL